ncbi:hypothetical protein B0J13DRAFT_567232 [Dactylonectria estremocensis]|uniref:HD domain-containing protein n=1 Tax=Dactylonectria estremocensis TaxID=1079267 RepID=A0A9P9DMB2_9HYPO|nr:hypothetical protein B0J13DRAFT_567232 [Dactylonectria estremocensis]
MSIQLYNLRTNIRNSIPRLLSSTMSDQLFSLIPQTKVCSTALALARDVLPKPLFNHSLRVYFLAKFLAEKENSKWAAHTKLPLLFVATACHDLGTSDLYNGKQRFEVEGADAAQQHLHSHGIPDADIHEVWVAIALHTSNGIAERISSLSRLVRLAVMCDFAPAEFRETLGVKAYAAHLEEVLPRLEVEQALGEAVLKQAVKIPDHIDSLTWPNSDKHPGASWPGILLRAHLENPTHEGINPAFYAF